MSRDFKTIIAACFGSSIGVSLLRYIRYSEGFTIDNFLFTCIFTTLAVSLIFLLWSKITKNNFYY